MRAFLGKSVELRRDARAPLGRAVSYWSIALTIHAVTTQLSFRSTLRVAIILSASLAPLSATARDVNSEPAGQVFGGGNELRSKDSSDSQTFAREDVAQGALCLMVESAARANDLPVEFFAHVIWQESHFRPQAVGPLTHTGQRARGIAQFMPDAANERGLLDPFNPVQALPKAAEFLADLRSRFGNIGLAAAAYNAGPRRVREWLAGNAGMPAETLNYVLATTGRRLEDWAAIGEQGKSSDNEAKTTCQKMLTMLKQEPNLFVSKLGDKVALAVTKPWGVQVATGFNRDQALTAYAKAIKDVNAALGQLAGPTLQPILFRSLGTSSFYQVRIGTSTRRQAENLCNQIREAHGACLVKRRGA
jgi:hypothetical protein